MDETGSVKDMRALARKKWVERAKAGYNASQDAA